MFAVPVKNMLQYRSCKLLQSSFLASNWKLKSDCLGSKRHFSFEGFYYALSTSTPVLTLQGTVEHLHLQSHLPWWAVIGLSTLAIRSLIIFPLNIHQQQVVARLSNIKSEIDILAPELNKEINIARALYKWDEITAKNVFKRQIRALHQERVIRDNCHPLKTIILGLFQIPVWVCFSIALRNLCNIAQYDPMAPDSVLSLKNEGLLWFTDLTSPDVFVIPLALFAVNIVLIEMHAFRSAGQSSFLLKCLLNASRVFTVIVALAAAINPSCVTFYWLCSSSLGLLQNIFLARPAVRTALKIQHRK